MSVQLENEVKLRFAGFDQGREALKALGASLVAERYFEDNTLFDAPDSRLRRDDCTLRLRTTPEGATLTFKGPRQLIDGVKSREEVECRVGAPDDLRVILDRVGMVVLFRYQKYREEWRWHDVALLLDETPIGVFIEIEGPLPAIHAAARAMGRGAADYVHDSYPALFRAEHATGDMVFPE